MNSKNLQEGKMMNNSKSIKFPIKENKPGQSTHKY